jgi:hypothetical protein
MLVILAGCNSDNKSNISVFHSSLRSTESRIFESYINYIEAISTSDFPLHTFKSNAKLYSNVELNQKFITDSNLIFFPATLWQVYLLKEKSVWKKYALNYSKIIGQTNTASNLSDGEIVQNYFLKPYEITKNKEYLINVVNTLSKQIADFDEKQGFTENISSLSGYDLELLLENHALCFATKATGDPVYRKFAVDNSYAIYKQYFQNNTRIASILSDDITSDVLKTLTRKDLNTLAIGLYGFTILYNETGIENYQRISKNIAAIFESIFNLVDSTGNQDVHQHAVDKVNLLSQSLVSLSFISLNEDSNSTFNQTSLIIYKHILNELEQFENNADAIQLEELGSEASFRLYYYLFEYELRKQNKVKYK